MVSQLCADEPEACLELIPGSLQVWANIYARNYCLKGISSSWLLHFAKRNTFRLTVWKQQTDKSQRIYRLLSSRYQSGKFAGFYYCWESLINLSWHPFSSERYQTTNLFCSRCKVKIPFPLGEVFRVTSSVWPDFVLLDLRFTTPGELSGTNVRERVLVPVHSVGERHSWLPCLRKSCSYGQINCKSNLFISRRWVIKHWEWLEGNVVVN